MHTLRQLGRGPKRSAFRLIKSLLLAVGGALFALVSFFEAASQLPRGRPSPVQLPVLTTPVIIQLSRDDREKLIRGRTSPAILDDYAAIAKGRLAGEAFDAGALWLWSFSQKGQTRRRALNLAEKVSLREVPVQLQLMQLDALSEDLPASLVHLDRALLVSGSRAPAVLETLAKGLDQPKLIKLLRPYSIRPWYKVLLQQALVYAPNPSNAAGLLLQTELTSDDLPPQYVSQLIKELILANKFDDAKLIASRFVGLRQSVFENFGLNSATTEPEGSPLTWTFADATGGVGKLEGNSVSFDIERSFTGPVMARITKFAAGQYILRQKVDASTSDLRIRWDLQCLTSNEFKQHWSQAIPSDVRDQVYETKLSIPVGCDIQRWEIWTSNDSGSRSATLSVQGLQLIKQ